MRKPFSEHTYFYNDRLSSLGVGALSDGLWRRASAAGASTPLERRAFGVADDMQVFSSSF